MVAVVPVILDEPPGSFAALDARERPAGGRRFRQAKSVSSM